MDNDNKTESIRVNFFPQELKEFIRNHLYLDYSTWKKDRRVYAKKLASLMRNKILNTCNSETNPEIFFLIAELTERIRILETEYQTPPHSIRAKT